jgi:hypothetical protein
LTLSFVFGDKPFGLGAVSIFLYCKPDGNTVTPSFLAFSANQSRPVIHQIKSSAMYPSSSSTLEWAIIIIDTMMKLKYDRQKEMIQCPTVLKVVRSKVSNGSCDTQCSQYKQYSTHIDLIITISSNTLEYIDLESNH